ncbi:TlpA family protein disulfide reductase [Marinicella marina]|nr:TlpA disulfide reductase family protein [Marinicella marina]
MINKSLTLTLMSLLLVACSDQATDNSPVEPVKPSEQTTATVAPETAAVAEQAENDNGIVAPLEFNLTDLDGNTIKASDYRGKWLVINYWATWCAPCRDEMPELVQFQKENADTVQVVGIAFEDATIDKLKSFAKDFNINYPLLTIDVYNPPEFAQEGGLGLPTTIVYNATGMRHKKHMGPIDAEGLLEMVQ